MAYITVPSLKLNTGAAMPAIGLGCWSGLTDEEHESAKPWIISALKNGYRHLDTAFHYGTEAVVGKAIRESGIPREEIFVTTKLTSSHHGKVAQALQESLDNAGLEYYDLFLMHWPQAWPDIDGNLDPRHPGPNGEPGQGHYMVVDSPTLNETWAEMEKLLDTGKVKTIGVSNYSVKTLTTLLETAKVVPAVNQIEMHPHQVQGALLEFAKEKGIILTAYSPTGYASVRNDPAIIELAKQHAVSPAQISLAWHIARGTSAVPKSTNASRQNANLHQLPSLTAEEISFITSLDKNAHLCQYPGPKNDPPIAMGWTHEQLGW